MAQHVHRAEQRTELIRRLLSVEPRALSKLDDPSALRQRIHQPLKPIHRAVQRRDRAPSFGIQEQSGVRHHTTNGKP